MNLKAAVRAAAPGAPPLAAEALAALDPATPALATPQRVGLVQQGVGRLTLAVEIGEPAAQHRLARLCSRWLIPAIGQRRQ